MNFVCVVLVAACCTVVQTTQTAKDEKNSSTETTSISTLVTTSSLSLEVETIDFNVTTEAVLTSTCEANSSCLISTIKPNASDTSAEANATNLIVIKKKHYRADVTSSGKELCTCNLQVRTSFFSPFDVERKLYFFRK